MGVPKKVAAFAVAEDNNLVDDLLGRLVAFRPGEDAEVETQYGNTVATKALVLVVDETGEVTDLGERLIFWQIVRGQLARATSAVPWIVGRLVEVGRAYKLDRPTTAEEELIAKALANYTA